MTEPSLTDEQRRRIAWYAHGLDRSVDDPVAAMAASTAMHSSDPATPYLGAWARVPDVTVDDVDRTLYEDRTAWRLHAMRRTLFVVPYAQASSFLHGAGFAIAVKERARLRGWVASSLGLDGAGVDRHLEALADEVRGVLAASAPMPTSALREHVPGLSARITLGAGKWAQEAPIASRLLFLLAMEGHLVRGRPLGTWKASQYVWADAATWFGTDVDTIDGWTSDTAADGRADIIARYLDRHGPATMDDLRWWTGFPKRDVVAALAAIETTTLLVRGPDGEPVEAHGPPPGRLDALLEDASRPWTPGRRVAVLPGLDPAPMGWTHRTFQFGDRGEFGGPLFDRNGNVGPTIWVDGVVIGGWACRPDGTIAHELLTAVDDDARDEIGARLDELAAWLDGVVITPRFPVPLQKRLAAT